MIDEVALVQQRVEMGKRQIEAKLKAILALHRDAIEQWLLSVSLKWIKNPIKNRI